MSLKEYLKDKNPRDLDVSQIAEFFLQFKFVEGSDVYKNIRNALFKNKLDGQAILDGAIEDLVGELGLTETDDIYQFVKLRVVLRKADFNMREKIDLDQINVTPLSWDKVCQLLDEQVGAKNENQRLEWYSYIEDESIDGVILLTSNTDNIMKSLKLNIGQITKFKALLEKIQGGSAQPIKRMSVSNNHSKIGTQTNVDGSAEISFKDVNVGNRTYYEKKN